MTSTWAFVPSAPLLALPGDDALAATRDATQRLVGEVVGTAADSITVLAETDWPVELDETHGGSLERYGLDVAAGGENVALGLGHTIGAWLLDRAGWTGSRRYVSQVDSEERTVLVVADGAACIQSNSPRGLDSRGPAFQEDLLTALRTADTASLAQLDLTLAAALWCTGAPVLREVGRATRDRSWHAQLRYTGAPLGVGYWVACWRSA